MMKSLQTMKPLCFRPVHSGLNRQDLLAKTKHTEWRLRTIVVLGTVFWRDLWEPSGSFGKNRAYRISPVTCGSLLMSLAQLSSPLISVTRRKKDRMEGSQRVLDQR
ncbi:hypothetical protein M8C21_009442 [Ambrosia artemisiifolia]|uniref:Uncharacterized protein n=1 Tax=Ambrosia artemisiifolia TaxID=4212 RepID=A0AAD5C8F5_AMBAR|nr:hypothetical protein M8C21_009442 [Ambrosia artemisiifolia]